MTTEQENEFRGGAWEHYHEAKKKHPKFAVEVVHDADLPSATFLLKEYKLFVKRLKEIGWLDFDAIATMSLREYIVAVLGGDRDAAKRELLDMAAVLMREWERISDESEVLK